MPYCSYCGKSVGIGERFCASCGKPLESRASHAGDFSNKATQFSREAVSSVQSFVNKNNPRTISLVIFILAFLCLFLPFVTVSCEGQEIATFSTMNLAFGTNIRGEEVPGNAVAVFLIIFILAGIGLAFWKSDKSFLAAAGAAILGLLFMIILKVGFSNEISREAGREAMVYIKTTSRAGFYFLFILMIAAAVLNGYIVKTKDLIATITKKNWH